MGGAGERPELIGETRRDSLAKTEGAGLNVKEEGRNLKGTDEAELN